MGRARRLQQGPVCAHRPAGAQEDRGVVLDLPGDQDRGRVGALCAQSGQAIRQALRHDPRRKVVFRHARTQHGIAQPRGAFGATGGQQPGDQPFQAAFLARIVVDAQIVDRQRQGRHQRRAQPGRTDEPVLDPHAIKTVRHRRGPAQYAPTARRGAGIAGKDQRFLAPEERLKRRSFPRAHPDGNIAAPVLAVGAQPCLHLVDDLFQFA